MRLFVAINLPPDLRQALADWAPSAGEGLASARWTPASNLHLTLRFLGQVDEAFLAPLASDLRDVARRHRPLPMKLSTPGMLPPQGRARVAFVGLERSAALNGLQVEVSGRIEERLAMEAEKRNYMAHVTVARCRRGWRRAERERWTAAACPLRGRAFEITYIDLMESRLSPSGAEYRMIERFLLGS